MIAILASMHEKPDKSVRRWVQFGVRDLLWLVLVVGLGVGWWADHSRLQRRLQAQNYGIRIFQLANTKANELAVVLREMYQRDADNALDIAADTRTNSIIVRGPEHKLLEAEATARETRPKLTELIWRDSAPAVWFWGYSAA